MDEHPRLRAGSRALVLDESDQILLCRFAFDEPDGEFVVWGTPGGGIEPGESLLEALHRELAEEIGLTLTTTPPHVWHQVVADPGHVPGYDGVINDFFLVRTAAFTPRGALTDAELAAENLRGFRWWKPQEIVDYVGPAVFAPRDLGPLLVDLLRNGPPTVPVPLEA